MWGFVNGFVLNIWALAASTGDPSSPRGGRGGADVWMRVSDGRPVDGRHIPWASSEEEPHASAHAHAHEDVNKTLHIAGGFENELHAIY
jgi:hypothetical protein